VTKYHVEFDVEMDSLWHRSAVSQWGRASNGEALNLPADAVITEVAPAAVTGWYRRDADDQKDVFHWTAEEIEEYPADQFYQNYTRMKDPEPWAEETTDEKYKDGYYRMEYGDLYRRQAGVWEIFLPSWNLWDSSSCNDDTIEEDHPIQYLGIEAP